MAFSMAVPWNTGEVRMHDLLRVPLQDNPTSATLTPQASSMLQRAPLLALGTLDEQSRPWTTLWGGSPGFSEPLGSSFICTRTLVDSKHDPVVQALLNGNKSVEMLQPQEKGKLVAGLAIDLMTRKRVKIAGRMVAGAISKVDVGGQELDDGPARQDRIQLVLIIDQSLGNCPKYLNQYELRPALVQSNLLFQGPSLSTEGRALIEKADMFFLSTSTDDDQDTNHRGGPPGFARVISSTEIIYPEYSGNRLYQSLGNLQLNPKVGITFPDYETGDVLYITGTAHILVDTDAANLLPGSNLAVKIIINESRFIQSGLPFRGTRHSPSPYNPRVRVLPSEGNIKFTVSTKTRTANLVKKHLITDSVARFTFSVLGGVAYSPGQWIALDFRQHLDIGYEHMRDEDPTSLNDDFVRTFTISSAPISNSKDKEETGFDITVRKGGPVTKFLFQQTAKSGFEVPILGTGGDFKIQQESFSVTPFIAGGVGITPLLGQLHTLNISPSRFKLLWTLRLVDVNLALDTLQQHPQLAQCTEINLTGVPTHDERIKSLEELGAVVHLRRLSKSDVDGVNAQTWYLCAGDALKKAVLGLLDGKTVVYEDFGY
jgi:ferredoxin-NADP reductase/predicted pyridoxine 5'-phosphate oxidase superfamily flavin-nucleotide-binding protein